MTQFTQEDLDAAIEMLMSAECNCDNLIGMAVNAPVVAQFTKIIRVQVSTALNLLENKRVQQ